MNSTVKSYAELCLEIQKLRKEVETQKSWIAYLEARLNKYAKNIHH